MHVKHLLLETPVHDVFTPSVSVCFINVLDIAICQKFMVVTAARCWGHIAKENHWILAKKEYVHMYNAQIKHTVT